MHFCSQCQNMYYISIDPNDVNKLVYYCRNYKKTLEENGCKFAPLEVAKHFSYELTCEFENVEPLGFHGEWRKEFYDFENEHKRRANLRPHYYNWPL